MRFNKDIEYALMALITIKDGAVHSASKVSEVTGVPYKLLCKLFQKLNQAGIVDSIQGTKGGYRLFRNADEITMQDVVAALHEDTQIISCNTEAGCHISLKCSIHNGMMAMQDVWDTLLKHITLKKFLEIDRRNAQELLKKALAG